MSKYILLGNQYRPDTLIVSSDVRLGRGWVWISILDNVYSVHPQLRSRCPNYRSSLQNDRMHGTKRFRPSLWPGGLAHGSLISRKRMWIAPAYQYWPADEYGSSLWRSEIILLCAIVQAVSERGPLPLVTVAPPVQIAQPRHWKAYFWLKVNLVCDGWKRRTYFWAVDTLLLIQNASGGYSNFEPIAARAWLEYFNGTEIFGQVMTEPDYAECTSSCTTALALFRARNGEYRRKEVDTAIEGGVRYIETSQRDEGGWIASWGFTFTYGAFFAMEALHCGGRTN